MQKKLDKIQEEPANASLGKHDVADINRSIVKRNSNLYSPLKPLSKISVNSKSVAEITADA